MTHTCESARTEAQCFQGPCHTLQEEPKGGGHLGPRVGWAALLPGFLFWLGVTKGQHPYRYVQELVLWQPSVPTVEEGTAQDAAAAGSGSGRVRTACVRGPQEVLTQGRLLHPGAGVSGGSCSPRRVTSGCAPSAAPASHSPCPSVSGSCLPASEEWPRAGRAWGLKRIRRLAFCQSQGFASFSGLQTSTYRM